ncbi:MAG: tail fiber domain-containing protein [Nitrososphaerota archaeon]|jgi:hypothetical protein|nr:tail fiber domain-containing protein [Nitrososphaerota archaeon]
MVSDSYIDPMGILQLASKHAPLSKFGLINYIWGFENGAWLPQYKTIPTGNSFLQLLDTETGVGTELFEIVIDEQDNPNYPLPPNKRWSPILGVSTGLTVKKDIAAGGYVSANQGLIGLGSGMYSPFDPPGAWMIHSQNKKLNFKGTTYPNNPKPGWRCIRTDQPVVSGNVTSYKMYEYQEISPGVYNWGPMMIGSEARLSTTDNGYPFGSSKPNWGSSEANQWFILTSSDPPEIFKWFGDSWSNGYAIDKPPFNEFFDTFEIRRLGYDSLIIQDDQYAHLKCANITAHNTNPSKDLTYGLGSPEQRWLGVCAETVYAAGFKKLDASEWNFASLDEYGFLTVAGLHLGAGYPDLYRASGNRAVISGNFEVDGNTALGSLNVNGIMGLTGDLNGNCFIQFGQGTGALRLAKTGPSVLSIQQWSGSVWNLADMNVAGIFTSWLNTTQSGGVIGVLAPLSFSGSTGTSGQVLTSNGSNLPTWQTPSGGGTWNGGTVTNPIYIKYSGQAGGQLIIENTLAGGDILGIGVGDNGLYPHLAWFGSSYGTNNINDFAYGMFLGLTGQSAILLQAKWDNTEKMRLNQSGALTLAGGLTTQDNSLIADNAKFFGLRNGATRLFAPSDGTLSVQTSSGSLGTLNTSNLFTDHLNSASAGGIYLMDVLKSNVNDVGYRSYYGGGGGGNNGGICLDRYGNVCFVGGTSANIWSVAKNTSSGQILAVGYDGWVSVLNLSGSGTRSVYAMSNGVLTTSSSSERYKENIEVLKDSSWIYELKPVSFEWKDSERKKTDGTQIGLIAEKVYALCPELAWTDDQGRPEGVHYEKLAVPMLAEMQKLRNETDELKAKLAVMQECLNKLELKVAG